MVLLSKFPRIPAIQSPFFGSRGQDPYNLLHLNAMYDLLQRTYLDADLCGENVANERGTLCTMVDRSPLDIALLIADREYENYNLMAHIQEKGWFFLIRVKDAGTGNGMSAGLNCPQQKSSICLWIFS